MSTNPFAMAGVELRVLVDDIPLLEDNATQLRQVTVESQLNLPALCEIEISDPAQLLLEETGLVTGNMVEVRAVSGEDPVGVPLFVGQIESVEVRYDNVNGLRSIVRAYDQAHWLLHGKKTMGYPMMSYAEVVEAIGLESAIETLATPSPVVYQMVVQSNESSWEFICRLGREIGYVAQIYIDPIVGVPTLTFGPIVPAETAPPPIGATLSPLAIVIGDEGLISLKATATASGLTAAASTRGWDQSLAVPGFGEGVTEDDSSLNAMPALELGGEFGGANQFVSLERMAENEAAVEAASEGLAMRLAGAYADIEAEVMGNPFIRPNTAISISKAGLLTGEYTVTAARHVYSPNYGGYRTQLSCAGHEDRTLMGLQDAAESTYKLNGVYPAIVTDVEDPEQLSRVLLSFPWLSETFVSNWARVVQAGASIGMGMQIMPEPLDEVLVAFENGQLDSPYVLGGLYSADRMGGVPPEELIEGTTMIRAYTSRDGHQLVFNDSPELSSVMINTTFGTSCILRLSPETGITIETVEGQPIIINSAAEVTVNAEGAVVINSSDVSISGEGAIEITAAGAISIEASEINLSADGAVSIEASEISLLAGEINVAGGIVSLGA
jgi:hypothetical protein